MSRLAAPEFARTCTCVRPPMSPPPLEPVAESVRRDFSPWWIFVTKVPMRKNVQRSVKGRGQGCRAWIRAVSAAKRMPRGVREEWE